MSSLLCQVALQLAIKDAKVPVMEIPRYSNLGKRVEEYQVTAGVTPPQPYCASALYTWFHEASALIGARNPLLRTGYCPDAVDYLKSQHRGRSRAIDAMPGDPIFYWFASHGRYAHTGIVLKNNGDGTVATVEANTNTDGARDGDGVYFKQRRVAGTKHFVANLQTISGVHDYVASVPQIATPSDITGQMRPVKVTMNGKPTDLSAYLYDKHTYVAVGAYAQLMQGKELASGKYDSATSTLNLLTQ